MKSSLKTPATTFASLSQSDTTPLKSSLIHSDNLLTSIDSEFADPKLQSCYESLDYFEPFKTPERAYIPTSRLAISVFSPSETVYSYITDIDSEYDQAYQPLPLTMAAPVLKSWAESVPNGHRDEEGRHIFLCDDGLRHSQVLPGIPEPYGDEVHAGRALYVLGVPFKLKLRDFENIFRSCGEVDKSPCIIDLESQETFRWVIMNTAEEAKSVLNNLHGKEFQGQTLRICKAFPPGKSLFLGGDFPIAKFFEQELMAVPKLSSVPKTVHGHPPPVTPKIQSQTQLVDKKDYPLIAQHKTLASAQSEQSPTSEDERQEQSSSTPTVATTMATFTTQATSWANIAGTAGGESRTIELYPGNRHPQAAPRLHPIGRIPSVVAYQDGVETLAEQMRVVLIVNLPSNISLVDVSNAIKEGPLVSINFGFDNDNGNRYVGVIFQYARDAEAFYQVLLNERSSSTPGRFRFIVDVGRGPPYPADDMVKLMGPPNYASRRLTIVKKSFFFMYNERYINQICEKVVEPDKIQCIWLYNGGNATVVFSDVKSAISVKTKLDEMRDNASVNGNGTSFEGLQTTFSKDPCVQEIHFISDMRE